MAEKIWSYPKTRFLSLLKHRISSPSLLLLPEVKYRKFQIKQKRYHCHRYLLLLSIQKYEIRWRIIKNIRYRHVLPTFGTLDSLLRFQSTIFLGSNQQVQEPGKKEKTRIIVQKRRTYERYRSKFFFFNL